MIQNGNTHNQDLLYLTNVPDIEMKGMQSNKRGDEIKLVVAKLITRIKKGIILITDGVRKKFCTLTLHNTFGIKQWTVSYWLVTNQKKMAYLRVQ